MRPSFFSPDRKPGYFFQQVESQIIFDDRKQVFVRVFFGNHINYLQSLIHACLNFSFISLV